MERLKKLILKPKFFKKQWPALQTNRISNPTPPEESLDASCVLHTSAVSSCWIAPDILQHDPNYLQLGIEFYEKGELANATYYWKLSATTEKTPLGIFFYGLSLLHGWGSRKSPAMAIRYLEKTAKLNTVDELQSVISKFFTFDKLKTLDSSIYQLGEYFWHGWEVPKNVTLTAFYFNLAASLGNPNAMNDLGFCFKFGHGVKKDGYRAAQLYRNASELGFEVGNNAWIWDQQYDNPL